MNFYKRPVTDIPPIFLPFEQSKPFQNCINCEVYLLNDETEYVIEKAIRQYNDFKTSDVIFEYAMCMKCADKVRKELSSESLERIQSYITNSNLVQSRQELINNNNWNIDQWLDKCAVTGQSLEGQTEYQIYGHCKGSQLVLSVMPYMIGNQATEEMSELLSAKTKDELNRFVDENFGIPPELKQPIKDHPILFV